MKRSERKWENDPKNPHRLCNLCGSDDEKFEWTRINKDGTTYTYFVARCKACSKERERIKTHCITCGIEKTPNKVCYCKECINEKNKQRLDNLGGTRMIEGQTLVRVKRYVEKAIKFNFYTDLVGLNELITLYMDICRSMYEYDNLPGGQQLQKMWNLVYKFYIENIEGIDEGILIRTTAKRDIKRQKRPYTTPSKNLSDINQPKMCSKCKEIKMGSDFYFRVPGRLQSQCKECSIKHKQEVALKRKDKDKPKSKFGVIYKSKTD